jgi:DNA gyrase subunit B
MKLKRLANNILSYMNVMAERYAKIDFHVERDNDNGYMKLIFDSHRENANYKTMVDSHFLQSDRFKSINDNIDRLRGIGQLPWEISFSNDRRKIIDYVEFLDIVFEASKKGLTIQRYKGLGEMNPNQLWDTTMDPDRRILLKVHVEDVFEADEIFSVLMGDNVEPRKKFIQENAMYVMNLDI